MKKEWKMSIYLSLVQTEIFDRVAVLNLGVDP